MTTIMTNLRYRGEQQMVLRLVLVGLVAGLGLSIPSRRDVEILARHAQTWLNDRLAEWDSQAPVDEGTYIIVAEPVATPERAAERAVEQPTVSDSAFAVVVDDMVASFARTEQVAGPSATTEVLEATAEIAPAEASAGLAIALPTEPAADDSPESPVTELAFDDVMVETTLAFAADLAEQGTEATAPSALAAMENLASALEAGDPAPAAAPAPISDAVFETVMNETASAFAAEAALETLMTEVGLFDTVAPAAPAQVAVVDREASAEVVEDLYPGEAYALNRLSDGLSESPAPTVVASAAPTPAAAPAPAGRADRWTHAVRLTREAVYAWASLLHGPAVVTIAH
jgi:hypothetical protein